MGEICVRTAVSMDGYLNRTEATAGTIEGDGWLHAAGLGSLSADGLLTFHGRIRGVILRGGEDVCAREVENAIEAHHDVSQVAVVGLPDPQWGEGVIAVVVPRTGAHLSQDEPQTTVADALAYLKWPSRWHIVDALTADDGR